MDRSKIPSSARIPLIKYLQRIQSKKQQVYLAKLLQTIVSCSSNPIIETEADLTLEVGFQILGKATAQLELLNKFNKRLMDLVSNYQFITSWPTEVWLLREQMIKQVRLGHDLVQSIIYHKAKQATEEQPESPKE